MENEKHDDDEGAVVKARVAGVQTPGWLESLIEIDKNEKNCSFDINSNAIQDTHYNEEKLKSMLVPENPIILFKS